jgi:hypothetical protein
VSAVAADTPSRRPRLQPLQGAQTGAFTASVLTGEPGDAVIMHPRLLHVVAPNSLPGPRLPNRDRCQARPALDLTTDSRQFSVS